MEDEKVLYGFREGKKVSHFDRDTFESIRNGKITSLHKYQAQAKWLFRNRVIENSGIRFRGAMYVPGENFGLLEEWFDGDFKMDFKTYMRIRKAGLDPTAPEGRTIRPVSKDSRIALTEKQLEHLEKGYRSNVGAETRKWLQRWRIFEERDGNYVPGPNFDKFKRYKESGTFESKSFASFINELKVEPPGESFLLYRPYQAPRTPHYICERDMRQLRNGGRVVFEDELTKKFLLKRGLIKHKGISTYETTEKFQLLEDYVEKVKNGETFVPTFAVYTSFVNGNKIRL